MAITGSQCRLAFKDAKKEKVNATVRQLLVTVRVSGDVKYERWRPARGLSEKWCKEVAAQKP